MLGLLVMGCFDALCMGCVMLVIWLHGCCFLLVLCCCLWIIAITCITCGLVESGIVGWLRFTCCWVLELLYSLLFCIRLVVGCVLLFAA